MNFVKISFDLAKVFLLLVFIDVGKKSKVTHSSVHQSNNVPFFLKRITPCATTPVWEGKNIWHKSNWQECQVAGTYSNISMAKKQNLQKYFFVFLTSLVVVVGSKMITPAPVWEICFFAFWCLVVCVLKISPQHLSTRFFLSFWCLVICGKKILLQHLPGRSKPQARTHSSWSSVGGHHIYLHDNDGGEDDDNDG